MASTPLAGVTPLLDPQATYAMFDGLVEKALLGHLSGDAEAAPRLADRVQWLAAADLPARRIRGLTQVRRDHAGGHGSLAA